MSEEYCPSCYTPLEVKDVGPCMDCGSLDIEIEHALSGKHTYAEYRIFGDLTLVLCNICMLEFDQYDSEYFGLPRSTRRHFAKMDFVRSVDDIHIGEDKYCPECMRRLAWLKFVQRALSLHEQQVREEQ